jgi:hypothetical protein
MKGVDPLVKREKGSASFGAKVAPCLWRVDPSFMNSVTGFGYVAKCLNILPDTPYKVLTKYATKCWSFYVKCSE